MLSACKEFESYLWEQVLKSMKSASEVFSTEEDDQKVSYFKETAMADIAKQITEQNLGTNSLAMQMYEQMKRNQGITADELEARLSGEGGIETEAPTDDAMATAASAVIKDETE
jgi:Rod binding domain-containing protein